MSVAFDADHPAKFFAVNTMVLRIGVENYLILSRYWHLK
jgi:hypothetical protein